jgi:hypothetical protein
VTKVNRATKATRANREIRATKANRVRKEKMATAFVS